MKTRLPHLLLALSLSFTWMACEPADQGCSPAPGVICTFAGTGVSGLSPDGLAPLDTEFYLPQDVTVGFDGTMYIIDWNNHRVRFISKDKTIQTIIGTGELGDAPNGVATSVSLNHPTHVSPLPNRDLIVSAWHNSKLLYYHADTELIETICGTGARNFNGDGLAPLETFLDLPTATAIGADGGIYFMDQANQRVRVLSTDGNVTTVAGSGEQGYSGDGGPAVDAAMHLPTSQSAPPAGRIALGVDGTLYIADTGNHVIRRVTTDGLIETIAGTASAGNGTSGGAATSVALNTPSDVDVDAEGRVYIADTMNNCVRRLELDGTLTTFAGQCGERGFAGDGSLAAQALLDRPYGLELGLEGELYIADTHNQRIRVVYPQ